jgi:hypothetical protein
MKLFRYVGGVVVVVAVFLVAMVKVVVLFAADGKFVDAEQGEHTIFQNESITVVYSTPTIAARSDKPEVVILGSSNARLGFRPAELSPLIGNVPVHNLGLGAQNMRSFCQIFDLIYRQTPSANRRNIVFVVGIWYGAMVGDERRWPDGMTAVDNELLRCFGLFRRTGRNGVQFILPDGYLSAALHAVWPLLVPRATYEQAWRYLLARQYVHSLPADVRPPLDPPDSVLDERVMGDDLLHITANHDIDMYGPAEKLGDSAYEDLIEAARRIHAAGGQLVLLDLPLTTAGYETKAYGLYRIRMKDFIAKLQREGLAQYGDLRPYFDNKNFFDYIHPRPKVRPEWARLAAEPIKEALKNLAR